MLPIIQSITSYINAYHTSINNIKILEIKDKIDYTMICFDYYNRDICIMVYNSTFIKIVVDKQIYAICDSAKSVGSELDKLHMYKYYASNG